MSHRVCLLALSLLLLCTLAAAAPGDPAKSPAAAAPATSLAPATSPATTASAVTGSPVTPSSGAAPPWLAPRPAMSVLEPAAKDPRAPVWMDCASACLAAKNQCYADCNDDEACETGCDNDWYCCYNACRGYYCP